MSKKASKKYFTLANAVLASSFFLPTVLFGAEQITFSQSGPIYTFDPITGSTGGIEITTYGQVISNGANNGIDVNSTTTTDNVVTIDADNLYIFNAINTTGTGSGINISQASASITVNVGSGITSAADGILIAGTNAIIDNTGNITGGSGSASPGSAIEISPLGTNATINNQSGGSLLSGAGAIAPTLLVNGTGLTLTNDGIIDSSGAGGAGTDTISLKANFISLTNEFDGTLTSNASNTAAINIANAGIGGIIINNGSINANNGGNGIAINQNFVSGSISNTGFIEVTSGLGGIGVFINADFTTFTNTGTIEATQAGDFAVVFKGGNTTGTFINSGSILANNNPAITLAGTFSSFNNSGIIQSTATTAIIANGGANGSLVNSSSISGSGGNTIDLSSGNLISLTNNGGTITGNVLLAGGGGTVLNMNKGTIAGTVTSSATPSILNLNGGNITGAVTLGNTNGNIVNLSGSSLQALNGGNGNDTFYVYGGSFTSLNGIAGNDILNINASLSTSAPISNIPTINVNNAGTVFTTSGPITGLTTMNVNQGASLNANENLNVGGVLTNNGNVAVNLGDTITTSSFIQNAGASFSPAISASGESGLIHVGPGGATLAANSTIMPNFGPLIPAGTIFDIIEATGGTIIDNATVVTNSAVVTFISNVVGGPILELTTFRNSFTSLASTANTKALAGSLDAISLQPINTINPDLVYLFSQLEHLPTSLAVEQALETLLPPLNYSEIAAAHLSMDSVFNTVGKRFEKRRHKSSGLNAGDLIEIPTGSWFNVFGANLNQDELDNIAGYNAKAAGAVLGSDWDICDFFGFGISASYARIHTLDKAFTPKDQLISSYQGTLYGWFEPKPNWFIDAMLGGVAHRYLSFHHIAVAEFNNTAIAKFNGQQYGGQIDLGYALLNNQYYLAPLIRAKYTHLALDSYDENELGGIGLAVQGQAYDEFTVGAGLRIATDISFNRIRYLPEVSALLLHDLVNDGQQSIAAFSGGGPSFATNGLTPGSTIFDLGLSLNIMQKDAVFTVKYDGQIREKFISNAAFLQVYYYW